MQRNKVFTMSYMSENIGDEIQTLATEDILDELGIEFTRIERDKIDTYQFDPTCNNIVILNGWFTNGYGFDTYYSVPDTNKEQVNISWPPKNYNNFEPLIFSFCMSEWGEERKPHSAMVSKEAIEFYKKSIGIGCRDLTTLENMKATGLPTYFSKCLTSTFNNKKYKKQNADNNVIFVDTSSSDITKPILNKITECGLSYHSVKFTTHKMSNEYPHINDRFQRAKNLLKDYANAKLVITTRLHVALPCFALGTPCIFINEGPNTRYDDYVPFFNSYSIEELEKLDLQTILSANTVSALKQLQSSMLSEAVKTSFISTLNYYLSSKFQFEKWCKSKNLVNDIEFVDDWVASNGDKFRFWNESGGQVEWIFSVGGVDYIRTSNYQSWTELESQYKNRLKTGSYTEWATSIPIIKEEDNDGATSNK